MLQVGKNPPQRWPEDKSLQEDTGNWWVVYTRPHNEKALAWDLQKLGISYYLPMTTKRTRRLDNGKPRKSVVCLFPSYISLVNYPQHKRDILNTKRILHAIAIDNQERFVYEMDQVSRITCVDIDLQVHNDLMVGQRVYIASGPFKGVEGTIENFPNSRRIYLNVEMFGRSVSMQIDPSILIPIN